MLRTSVRYLRGLIRRGLGILGRHDGPQPYRPDLSESALLTRLLPDVDKSGSTSTADRSAALGPGARTALWARLLLEDRFFIAPTRITAHWNRLQHIESPWRRQLQARAVGDREHGIPVYAEVGPRLGADFPWGQLTAGPEGDALYAKRPHRFAFAPRNGLASIDDSEASIALHDTLLGWIACAERARDPMCYDSNLGVIQRVLALSWCWAFLAARPPQNERGGLDLELLVLRILRSDASFLESRLGDSVANNHLLADWFGGWYLQQLLPHFLDRPETDYENRFRDELLRQTYADGGSFEHSAHYHEFACEMGAAYLLLCRRQGRVPDADIEQRVRLLLRFQSTITGPTCQPLPFGNAVEDTLFPLDAGEAWCAGSLREIERALFRPELAPAPPNEPSLARAYWMLGGELAPASTDVANAASAAVFPDAGFHLYEDDKLAARLVFRTGPDEHTDLTAGHMHADFLSIYLSVNRTPILVDSGTYTYRYREQNHRSGKPSWRRYLAGPGAHNTLCIDRQDPLGPLQADFRERHANARVRQRHSTGSRLCWAEARILEGGAYDGHVRGCIHVHGHYWVIYDRAPASGGNGASRWYGFQFAPGLKVSVRNARTEITSLCSKTSISLFSSMAETPSLLQGSIDPLGGWFSPRYGEIIPAPQLRYPAPLDDPITAFVVAPGDALRECTKLEVTPLSNNVTGIRLYTGRSEDRLVLDTGAHATDSGIAMDGLEFDGKLLWLRIENGQVHGVRWLSGRRLAWGAAQLHVELLAGPGDVILGDGTNDTPRAAFHALQWS